MDKKKYSLPSVLYNLQSFEVAQRQGKIQTPGLRKNLGEYCRHLQASIARTPSFLFILFFVLQIFLIYRDKNYFLPLYLFTELV